MRVNIEFQVTGDTVGLGIGIVTSETTPDELRAVADTLARTADAAEAMQEGLDEAVRARGAAD